LEHKLSGNNMGLCLFFCLALSLAHLVAGGNHFYGRAFGTVQSHKLTDKGRSHHLEVYLDPMPGYPNFQANIDVRSLDGSSLFVASLQDNLAPVLQNIQSQASGVQRITPDQGVVYCNCIDPSNFQQLPETDYVTLLTNLLDNAQNVYFFGQVYEDADGTAGIHDIHRTIIHGYGDGALVVQDSSGNFNGVFAYFQNQQTCPTGVSQNE